MIRLTGMENKFVLYLQVFCYSFSVLKICSTQLILQGYICIFHMEKHNNKAISVTFVETLLTQNNRWFLVLDIRISGIFYKIQKAWAQIITTNGINFLIARPLYFLFPFPIPKIGKRLGHFPFPIPNVKKSFPLMPEGEFLWCPVCWFFFKGKHHTDIVFSLYNLWLFLTKFSKRRLKVNSIITLQMSMDLVCKLWFKLDD